MTTRSPRLCALALTLLAGCGGEGMTYPPLYPGAAPDATAGPPPIEGGGVSAPVDSPDPVPSGALARYEAALAAADRERRALAERELRRLEAAPPSVGETPIERHRRVTRRAEDLRLLEEERARPAR